METNFFELICNTTGSADLKITITKQQNDKMIVSVLPFNEKLNDEAKNLIQPMILNGTVQELNNGFFKVIQKPLEKTAGLFSNMSSYLQTLEETKKQSKMEQENKEKEKKAKEDRKKKYEAQIQKVSELEAKEKWGEAIGAMPKAADFPEQADDINKKLEELRQRHGQLSLL